MRNKIIVIFIAMALLVTAIVISSWHPDGETYEVYYAKAPFGVLWREERGSLIFGYGTELQESYIVKFWDGEGYLRSVNLKAEDTVITVDGTFRLTLKPENPIQDAPVYELYGSAILHLPDIPERGENVTWQIVG